MKIKFPSPYGVSFILILRNVFNLIYEEGFRLLTEYHSFLYTREFIQPSKFSFRLLTEYHSFLYKFKATYRLGRHMFPSPYGVSFILIRIY